MKYHIVLDTHAQDIMLTEAPNTSIAIEIAQEIYEDEYKDTDFQVYVRDNTGKEVYRVVD